MFVQQLVQSLQGAGVALHVHFDQAVVKLIFLVHPFLSQVPIAAVFVFAVGAGLAEQLFKRRFALRDVVFQTSLQGCGRLLVALFQLYEIHRRDNNHHQQGEYHLAHQDEDSRINRYHRRPLFPRRPLHRPVSAWVYGTICGKQRRQYRSAMH